LAIGLISLSGTHTSGYSLAQRPFDSMATLRRNFTTKAQRTQRTQRAVEITKEILGSTAHHLSSSSLNVATELSWCAFEQKHVLRRGSQATFVSFVSFVPSW
jgi:hypothetical protein